jgi:protein-L-isoaspartate(D-aspartate) O-methyltransferase
VTTRKSWMVEMPASAPAKATRSGKPIAAPVARKAPAPAPAPRAKPSDPREREEVERRERTQGTGHVRASLNPDGMRARLVERLRTSGIRHPAVLAAMGRVPRHRFVDEGLASRAYDDTALPIGHAQTISQPYVVARMTELLIADLPRDPRKSKVLEVGTGCGYQAAVLAEIFGEVYTIERIRALHDRARDNLRALRVPNLRLVYGDGRAGVPDAAPFDAMILAAAGDALPEALLEQLAVGGRVIAPVTTGRGAQTLCLAVRTDRHNWSTTLLDAVRFVPLRTGLA